ncbi:MAG: PTS sugar transporter subunit IIA [Lentisphaeria bacterium]|nr:PTS sugar transporter subunit IIA [Lentisphaeria bacterium]
MKNSRHFYDLLALNNIVCRSKIRDRDELLRELLRLLKRHHPGLDLEAAEREVTAREALFPTVIAPGLALPHARMPNLDMPLMGMVCTPDGVDFNSELGKVQITILLLTPSDDPNLHLQIIAELARVFSDTTMVDRVLECPGPAGVLELFDTNPRDGKEFPVAGDVMTPPPAVLHETDTLAEAIRRFATCKWPELVVLDDEGDARGVLALTDLLKYSLPEHLLWMDDLSFIDRFQPFAEVLRTAGETRVADVMREDFMTVDKSAPAIQVAKLFTVHQLRILVITDRGKYAGAVELKAFCAKLFWE